MDPKILLLDEPLSALDALTRGLLQSEIEAADRKTVVMITNDVDEALFLADRIVMMTSGPKARVGQILEVPFGRPRSRGEVLEHPDHYSLRGELISFLESEDRRPDIEDAA